MSDYICRETMTRCQTPGMCSPHGGCQPKEEIGMGRIDLGQFVDWVWNLKAERDELKAENAGLKTGYEAYEQVVQGLKAEVEALRKDAERWRFFSVLANDLQAFPHSWGQMTPEKMDFMCDEAMAGAAMGKGEQS